MAMRIYYHGVQWIRYVNILLYNPHNTSLVENNGINNSTLHYLPLFQKTHGTPIEVVAEIR